MTPGQALFIRADASQEMGSGHVMRCLALAEAAQNSGMAVHFLCRPLVGHLVAELQARRWPHTVLDLHPGPGLWQPLDLIADAQATLSALKGLRRPGQRDWLLVDHYQLDARWHRLLSQPGLGIAVLDDLANRALDCDLLVDQNALGGHHQRYPALTPSHCHHLLGPSYTLLRQEIRDAAAARQHTAPHSTVVFLGGADNDRLTDLVLDRLERLPQPPQAVQVLAGAMNPRGRQLAARCETAGHAFALASRDLAPLLATARQAIVACGMTAVELQALGVPSMLVPLSEIQMAVAQDFARRGRAVVLPPSALSTPPTFHAAWQALQAMPQTQDAPGFIALDGAQRVIAHMQDHPPCTPT